jgi:hypothetical protein
MRHGGYDQPNKATEPAGPRLSSRGIGPRFVFGVIALTLIAQPSAGFGASVEARPAPLVEVAPAATGPFALIENRRILSYPMDQVWTTTIRYLRIDRGFDVTDRDEQAGYMLFEFPLDGDRSGRGSIEMFPLKDAAGRPSVSIAVNTGAGPLHLPNAILDGVAAKVRAERGQPAAPPKHDPPPPPKQDDPEDDHSVPLLPPAQDP